MGGDARQVHAPGVVLDEEQDIQAAQEHGIDVKEVRGQDAVSLGGQERAPGRAAPVGRGVDSGVVEDLPDGRRRDLVAEAGEFSVMRRYPQTGLSRAISRARSRMARATGGRPGREFGFRHLHPLTRRARDLPAAGDLPPNEPAFTLTPHCRRGLLGSYSLVCIAPPSSGLLPNDEVNPPNDGARPHRRPANGQGV
jgi:hypothetical protein